MIDLHINVLSRVYIKVPVSSNLDLIGTNAPISGALVLEDTAVELSDFEAGVWTTGLRGPEAAILVGPGGAPSIGEFLPEIYDLYLKITDSPQIPVLFVATIRFFAKGSPS